MEVTAFTEHQADSEELVAALADVDIVVVMRERTPPLPRRCSPASPGSGWW